MLFNAALCLQGGAMRSVFLCGVLDAFMDNNIDFSDVYGISAGSKEMQYYPGHQRGVAMSANLAIAKDPKVFDMANLLMGNPVMDSYYYLEEIRNKKFPLDESALKESPIRLHIGTTNIRNCEIEYFTKDDPNFIDAMIASCAIPVLQPATNINGNEYLDGGCVEPIPYRQALKDGFNKIVVVQTREKGYRDREIASKFGLFLHMKYRDNPNFVKLLENNDKLSNEFYDEIDKLEEEGKIIVIRPSYNVDVDRLERDIDKLNKLYQDGYNEGIKALNKFIDYFKD